MNNPYETPVTASQVYSPLKPEVADRRYPGLLLATCILIAIISGMGLMGSLASIVGSFLHRSTMAAFDASAFPSSDGAEMNQALFQIQEDFWIPNLIVYAANMIVAPLLLVGAIGIFVKQSWAPGLLKLGLGFAIPYLLVCAALTGWQQWETYKCIKASFDQFPGQGGMPEEMGGIMMWFMVVSIGVGVGILLVQAVFYVFAFLSLSFERNKRFFATFGTRPPAAESAQP